MSQENPLDVQEAQCVRNADVLDQINDGTSESRIAPNEYDAWVKKNITNRHFSDFDEPYSAWAHKRTTWIRYMVELARKKAEQVKKVVIPFPQKNNEDEPTEKKKAA